LTGQDRREERQQQRVAFVTAEGGPRPAGAGDSPTFTVGEVAKFFFGRTSYWLRWCERKAHSTTSPATVADRRSDGHNRAYTLEDVEKVARMLYENRAISETKLIRVLMLIKLEVRSTTTT
jgi:hypothetical protein